MKILQVNSILPYETNSGGAEKLLLDLSNHLKENGHDVRLATGSQLSKFKGLENYTISRNFNKHARKLLFDYYSPKAIEDFKNILNKFNPDIVHFHSFYGISSYLARYSSQHIPTVVTTHDYWSFCYWSTMVRNGYDCPYCMKVSDRAFNISDTLHFIHTKINKHNLENCILVSPSKYMARKLDTIGGFKKITTIYNGVTLPRHETSFHKTILWVGRLSQEKGLQTILPALNDIKQTTSWEITILGTGVLRNEFEKKYRNIQFLGFQNPVEYYKRSSILVFSSIWPENLPYTLLEAMSYGLVVIAPKSGGITEIIDDRLNGLLYTNLRDFELIINSIIKNPTVLKRIGDNAQAKINNTFRSDLTFSKYLKLYSAILS